MTNFLEFFTDHPFATLLIGLLFCVIGVFIYIFLKKDISGLSKDIESKFSIIQKDTESKFSIIRKDIESKFSGFSKDIESKLSIIQRDQAYIKELLGNHITDTTKKIDELRVDTNEKFNKLESKLDKLLEKNKLETS